MAELVEATFEIDDKVLATARVEAARRGITVEQLVIDLLTAAVKPGNPDANQKTEASTD